MSKPNVKFTSKEEHDAYLNYTLMLLRDFKVFITEDDGNKLRAMDTKYAMDIFRENKIREKLKDL